jgi:hypothetical protein
MGNSYQVTLGGCPDRLWAAVPGKGKGRSPEKDRGPRGCTGAADMAQCPAP